MVLRPLRYTEKLTRLLNTWARYFLKLIITHLARELTAFMPREYSPRVHKIVFTRGYQMKRPCSLLGEFKNSSQSFCWKIPGKHIRALDVDIVEVDLREMLWSC
jgi:hypothetical protein